MKVGTDAVLLGSWVKAGNASAILDIGTGTGLIAIMLAQKSGGLIEAIDLDEDAISQAKENGERCPWSERITFIHTSLQDFKLTQENKYDLIVSNPPYFVDASKAPEAARNKARHTDNLSYRDLIDGVKRLLDIKGRFCMILPTKEGTDFRELAFGLGLYCNEIMKIKTKMEKQEKRLLMQFEFVEKPVKESELVIQIDDTTYTKDYIEFTKEYYVGLKRR